MRTSRILALLVTIAALVIAPARPASAAELAFTFGAVPDGASGYSYNHVIGRATGGTPPYSFTATGLPAGMHLYGTGPYEEDGRLAGTPTAAGDYPFDFTLTDGAGDTVSGSAALHVEPGQVRLRATSLDLHGTICEGMSPGPFIAEGGALPYTWTLSPLPRGLFYRDPFGGTDYSNTVRIVGRPKVAGTFPVSVNVATSEGTTATLARDMAIAPRQVEVAWDQDGDGTQGLALHAREGSVVDGPTLKASCGDGTSFAWRALDQMPRGLRLSENGRLHGTPQDPGATTFRAEVTSAGYTDAMKVTFEVRRARLHFVTGEQLPRAQVGRQYGTRVYADGGFPGYRWQLVRGSLPPGISRGPRGDGWLRFAGRPERAGTWEFRLRLADTQGHVVRKWFSLRVVR